MAFNMTYFFHYFILKRKGIILHIYTNFSITYFFLNVFKHKKHLTSMLFSNKVKQSVSESELEIQSIKLH